ncbi:MAG TPA: J domain-containing protein [Myxococcales bacterium]
MDTFELLPSLAQGELSDTSTPELVAAVFRSRASGTLWLETPQAPEIRVFFHAGDMCGTTSFPGVQNLAQVLLANDWVNALDIDSSREEAAKTGKRHGAIMVAKGLLTTEQLRAALVAQHTTNLLTLMGITEGKYDWRGWEPPPAWAREVVVDPVGCLVDALEQEQHAQRRAKVMRWLGDHPVRLSVDWPDLQARLALAPIDRRAAAVLALPRRLQEFVRASQLAQSRAEAVLAALLLAGGAEPQPEGDVRAPAPAASEQTRVQSPAGNDEELELDLPPAPAPSAGEPEPPAAEAGAGMDRERANDLRKKMLARGIRNLGSLPTREEYEGSVAVTPKVTASKAKGQLAPDEQRFADEVRSRVEQAPGQSAYARLGVDPGATSETIRNAYLEAAKRFHPDHSASPGLASVQAELQTLFALLKEAYETISTPEARTRYDASLKAAHGGTRKEESAIALKMGDVLLKKRDFEAALAKLRRAVDLDATGDALAALAWGLVSDPKASQQAKEEAASLINRALRAPGVTARTYYVAGVLWRTKDPESALDAFRKALEIDPKHPDAALEIRLMEQRRGKPPKGGGGVLSGLLFGKRKG